jgi:putative transcriptional regulator
MKMTNKDESIAVGILAGLNEAIEIAKGTRNPAGVHKVVVPNVDVKSLRKSMKLSQRAFSNRYGFNERTVQDWEQGRARPERSTRILLGVIEKHPEVVEEVLEEA